MIAFAKKNPKLFQIIKFGIVGVLNNLLGYAVYLLLTYFWFEPKTAITLLYPIGIALAYYSHSKYTFSHQAGNLAVKLKFLLVYLISYVINFLLLFIFSDVLNFPHQLVQAVAIVVVGGSLYVMLKFFVFTKKPDV